MGWTAAMQGTEEKGPPTSASQKQSTKKIKINQSCFSVLAPGRWSRHDAAGLGAEAIPASSKELQLAASHLVTPSWWAPEAFNRENSGMGISQHETQVSLPTPPLFTPRPGAAQLWQVGDCGSKWLPAHWHHIRVLLYLTPPADLPLSITHLSKNRTGICQLHHIQQASPSQSSLLV